MARRTTKGRRGVFWELPDGLVEELTAEAKRHGRSQVQEVIRAIRRHLASPEPVEPLAPLPAAEGKT